MMEVGFYFRQYVRQMYTVLIVQAYQTSHYVVPRGGIFFGKWRSSFAGSSDGKMNVHSACSLNTRHISFFSQQSRTCKYV
jgi:hypothetical protein